MVEGKEAYEGGRASIKEAINTLKKVAERVGAAKFSTELETVAKEIDSLAFLDKERLSLLSSNVEAWKEKYYSEFTTIQDISEFQGIFIFWLVLLVSIIND